MFDYTRKRATYSSTMSNTPMGFPKTTISTPPQTHGMDPDKALAMLQPGGLYKLIV